MNQPTPNLNAALAKFHSEMGPIPKNRTANIPMKNGGSYKYKYADFADLIEASRAKLQANGLAITQGAKRIEADWAYVTTLLHASGEERSFEYPMRRPSEDPKADGCWFTYYRRYGASAILGLSTDEDDDGTGATKGKAKEGAAKEPDATKGSRPEGSKPKGQDVNATITEAQAKRLFAIAASKGWKNDQVKTLLASGGVKSTAALKKGQYDDVISIIESTDFDNWYVKHGAGEPG